MQRRTFLKTSAAAATAIAAGTGFQGCGNDGGIPQLDPSGTHRARFLFRQPSFDSEALLQALPAEERGAIETFFPEAGEYESVNRADTFVFHSGGSKLMQRLPSARSASGTQLHIVTNEFSTDKASIVYVTHRRSMPVDGSDEGLSFMYLYVPSAQLQQSPTCSSDSNATADGNTTDAACQVDIEVEIDDPVFETIRAMLFLHPALHQLRADRARALLEAIDITTLQDYRTLYTWLTVGMDRDAWYTAGALKDPDSGDEYVFSHGVNKDKTIFQYLPVTQIMAKLRTPMRDLVRRAGNDPDLAGIFRHDTVAEDPSDVTPTRMRRFVQSRAERRSSTITLQDHSERDGYVIELPTGKQTTFKEAFGSGALPDEAPVVKLVMKNHYRRYIAFYIRYIDLDGNVIEAETLDGTKGRSAWAFMGGNPYSAGIYNDYMDDTSYLLKLVTHPAELLGIPVEKYAEAEAEFAFPDAAHGARIYAVTIGSGGERNPLMERLPVGMTWTFDLIIPLFLLASSYAIRNEKEWVQLIAETGLEFAQAFIKFLTMHSANGGGVSAANVLELGAEAGTAILLKIIREGVEKLAIFLVEEITEESIEDSTPILGAALMVGNIAVDTAEIAQTGFAINNSSWSASFVLSRTHRVEVQVLPDENNFQFPEAADTAVLILKSPKGKVDRHVRLNKATVAENVPVSDIDGTPASGKPLFDPGSADTVEAIFHTFFEVPEGGEIDVIALFTAGSSGYVVGHAKYRIGNVGEVKTAFRITQIKVALTDKSIYRHKRILRYDTQGELRWTETATPPATVYNLASDGTAAGQISGLLSIAINDKSGALGYSFTTEIDGRFRTVAKNVSAKANDPSEGYREKVYAGDTNVFVLYDMLSEPKTPGVNFILQLKYDPVTRQNTYFAKTVTIDPASGDFGISESVNRGKFRVAIDAAAYDATHGMVAGLDYTHRRLHILTLSDRELDDDDTTHNGSVYSVPRNIVGAAGAGFKTLRDILYDPRAVAFAAGGALMVIDRTPIGDYARMFSSSGTALNYSPFGGYFKPLKAENRPVVYLDLSVDADGYFFVLKRLGGGAAPEDYKLDLYAPDGTHLSQTGGMTAHKMRSDFWRNIYTLNYERTGKDGSYSEPTLSIWVPPVTGGKVVSDYD